MEKELAQKYEALQEKMSGYVSKGVVIAFSGGVDSTLLLKLACMIAKKMAKETTTLPFDLTHGGKNVVYAVTVQTKLHPAGDLEAAKLIAAEVGALHKVLQMDELEESGIETNPVNRCYLCKRSIFRKIKALAEELEAECILEGTNEDDLHQYRPGILALRELEIISPLADCGLTKAEIRKLAEHFGISVAKRPSMPCLATRFPYDTTLSYELLAKVDEGERYLRELGFYNVRLRAHRLTGIVGEEWLARIEVDREDIPKLIDCKAELTGKIKELGFGRVTVDLEGFRSGSMDEGIKSFDV